MGLIGMLIGLIGSALGTLLGLGGALLGVALAFLPLSPLILVVLLIVLLARASHRNAHCRPDPRWTATPNQPPSGASPPGGVLTSRNAGRY